MADLLARFQLVDEMSERLANMAESGQRMAEQMERAGAAANSTFGNISGRITAAASSARSATGSIGSLQDAAERAASSTNTLEETINNSDSASRAASEAFNAQRTATIRCAQASGELSNAVDRARETERSLSDAMENTAQVSRELADNDRVSAETREALARASQEAEDAMNELTVAQREADEAMAEYERIITSGTENLDELEQAAARASNASANLDAANRRAADATDELADAAQRAADEAEDSSDRGQNAAETLASVLTGAGITKIVLDIADAFMEASEAAAVFEVGIKKISTIADTTQVSLSQMSSDILSLSLDTGILADNLEEATYSALSASVNTADAVQFTATASKLASGGFTSSATAVDVLTTALNAYGLEADKAGSISDMLITTQNLGKTTVDELAASVGKVIPLASAYGVEMDNLSAAYAELTKGGIATAEAGTYLKSMLNELGDSGSAVSSVLKEQTGSSFSQLIEKGYSLGDVMEVLGDSVNGNAGAFNELWSSSEAGIGALALYNAGAVQFNATLDAMQNSLGATETAYSTMTNTTAHAQEELANASNNLKISIGQNINPLMKSLYELGTDILNGITKFSQEHPIIVKAISAVAIGIGVVAVAVVGVTTATTVAKPAIISFGIALKDAFGPIGWVAIAISAVVAAGVALVAMLSDANDETAGMTATTRAQYYELQDLNAEYERTCEQYGETSKEALELRYQVDNLSAAFEANRQTIEEFTAEVDALCESTLKLSDDFNSALTDIKSQEIGALALIQRYEELATQAEFATGQEEELEAITNKLAESYPDLAEQFENTTMSVEDYVAAMERACEQQAEQQRRQQAEETFIEALDKQAQLEAEIAKAEANLNAEREAHGMYYDKFNKEWTSGWYKEDSIWAKWTTDLDTYNEELEKLLAAKAENEATIEQIRQGWADIAEAAAEAAKAEAEAAAKTITSEEAVAAAYESVRGNIEKLCVAYDEAYEAALESLEGQFGLFDEASTKSEEYVNSTVKNAQAALESQIAYWDSYLANVEILKNTSAEDLGITQENYAALMAYAQNGSEQAAGLAASMAKAIQNGDGEAVAALANTVGELNAKQEEIAAATADWVTDFTSQMDGIEREMQDMVDGMNLEAEAKASAMATISSYADAIREGKDGAVQAAEEVSSAVAAALANINITGAAISDTNTNIISGTVPTAVSATKTTMNVITGQNKVSAYANGTTNAESIFLAGENGPELVARPAAAYAKGTTNSADYFIAGENGPELIVGEQGSTVFPTGETDRLINALNRKEQPLQVFAGTGNPSGGSGEQVKHISLDIAGSGAIEVGGGEADRETILEVLLEHLKPVLINVIQSEIFEEGEQAYEY